MKEWFRVPREKQLSKQAVITLMNHTLFQFGNSLSVIFINLYLWRLTNSLWINGLFNLIALLAAPAATWLLGRMAKQKDRLTAYRYGIFLTAFFYLCIVIVQERIVEYYVLFAIMKGISTACYWLGYFTLMYDVSNNDNRHRYLGWNMIFTNVAMLVGPAFAGAVISTFSDLTGYLIVFSMAFVMFFFATLGSLRMEKSVSHHRKYYMRYLPLLLRKRPVFGRTLLGWLIVGLPQGILMYIPHILLFDVLPNEQFVGYMNVVFLALSILSSYVISRMATTSSTVLYLIIAAVGFIVSSSVLLWQISMLSVIVFMCVSSLFKPLQANAYAAHYYKWIGKLPLKQHFRVESIVLRETAINIGRALGVILFMLTSGSLDSQVLPWVVVSVMALQLLIPVLSKDDLERERRGFHVQQSQQVQQSDPKG
jgi:YQGE family putative transporter